MEEKEEVKTVMLRVPIHLIKKLRKHFPELRDERDATLVRIALNKYLQELEKPKELPPQELSEKDYEWIDTA